MPPWIQRILFFEQVRVLLSLRGPAYHRVEYRRVSEDHWLRGIRGQSLLVVTEQVMPILRVVFINGQVSELRQRA